MIADRSRPFDPHDAALAAAYDELPLWSAPFGLLLLDRVRLKTRMTVLDIGCGTGFPLLELAARIGPSCRAYGLDPWPAALDRVRMKVRERGLHQVVLCEGRGEAIPLEDGSCDAVVSNNGLNNVEDRRAVLQECARVLRPGGQLLFTFNLPGTMEEFYRVLRAVLMAGGHPEAAQRVASHIHARRPPLREVLEEVDRSGFRVREAIQDRFRLRYADGAALLGHFFIRMAFLGPWLEIVPGAEQDRVFTEVATRLDGQALLRGGLTLTVPYACVDAERM